MAGLVVFAICLAVVGVIVWAKLYLDTQKAAKRNPFMPNTKQIHDNIMRNIEKSKTYADLINCHEWVMRNEFVLSPGQRANLIKKIREKEIKLEEGLSDIMGYPIGKIQ
jgi:hypothetical protein